MPFSHHSHSGQFCGHATDTLAAVVAAARAKRMSVFALTEHVPRPEADFYPGEKEDGHTPQTLAKLFDDFIAEARRLQSAADADADAAATGLRLLVGFEAEWIRGAESAAQMRALADRHAVDFFVGSVHHVRAVPIDFDAALFQRAAALCGGELALLGEYFDSQLEMLRALQPRTVGHFDLIRLLSAEPDRDWRTYGDGAIWDKIVRNLECVKRYGGLVEINTSAWRKGLQDPYPRKEICELWVGMGGSFVLSDDSHGVAHVGTNYDKIIPFLEKLGNPEVAYLVREDGKTVARTLSLQELRAHPFWNSA